MRSSISRGREGGIFQQRGRSMAAGSDKVGPPGCSGFNQIRQWFLCIRKQTEKLRRRVGMREEVWETSGH